MKGFNGIMLSDILKEDPGTNTKGRKQPGRLEIVEPKIPSVKIPKFW